MTVKSRFWPGYEITLQKESMIVGHAFHVISYVANILKCSGANEYIFGQFYT